MKHIANKNSWVLMFLLLSGIVLGNFLGTLTANLPGFSWLNYGQSFGFDSPLVLNLGIIVITFALKIKITIAAILGLVISIIIYRFL